MPFDKLERCCLVTVPRHTVGPACPCNCSSEKSWFCVRPTGEFDGAKRPFRLAAETLQPLVNTKVADAELFENLGNSYLALEQISPAEEAFQSAITVRPRSASAQYSLGYVLQAQGRSLEAIRAYEASLRADPEKAEALGNLAVAYASLDEKNKAIQAMQKALILEPGNLKWRALVSEWMREKPLKIISVNSQ